jgi:hypothetical protein
MPNSPGYPKKPNRKNTVTSGPGSGAGGSGAPSNARPIIPGAAKLSRTMPTGGRGNPRPLKKK